ncbi:hypothetical protein [Clostridium chauvoei]|uniref:hypothetical protein n=1 Tax=Clostridium chauvoei TaxID=46867 RepID=UPI0021A300CF|nr:hypothetical protein [Clostridium chauvoei]
MVKYFIFIILILGIIAMYFYYNYKLALTRKQLMIASKKRNTVKTRSINRIEKTPTIKFSSPNSKVGITNINTNLYLAPTTSSPILKNISIRMEVQLLDTAELNSETWYYVNLPIDTDINCRGWLNSKDFSILYSDSTNLTKSN